MLLSKLWPHSIGGSEAVRQMIDAGCGGVKFVDGFGQAAYAKSRGVPYIIGRRIVNLPNQENRPATAENMRHLAAPEAAQLLVDLLRPTFDANPDIRIWEGWNEPVWGSAEDMKWYAEACSRFMVLLKDLGLRAVFGNFATGNPGDLSLWDYFAPAFDTARLTNSIYGLHEYGGTWMWWMTGRYQVNPNEDAGDEGWTTLRYRKIVRRLHIEDIPLIINECGLDAVHPPRSGFNTGHWKFCTGEWLRWGGHDDPIDYWKNGGRDPEIYYAEQLKWYDRELQKDPYVLGATIFTVGHGATGWGNFEIENTRVISHLVQHITASASEPAPTPDPEPPQETPSMAINFSELDYSKTYHVRNNIFLPVGLKYKFAPPTIRVSWKDIKPGSPTFGQRKDMDQDFAEPECVELNQGQMPDIPYPLGKSIAIKDFVGFKPRWSLIYFSFKTVPGTKYLLKWKVRPELVSGYNPDNSKIYAPDPASGWLRIRVRPGEVEMDIDGLNPDEVPADQAWSNGRDFPFGVITEHQVVIDAIQDVMTVGLETLGPHGLPDNDFISFIPEVSIVSTPTQPNTGDDTPAPAGTLREAAQRVLAGLNGISTLEQAANDIVRIVG